MTLRAILISVCLAPLPALAQNESPALTGGVAEFSKSQLVAQSQLPQMRKMYKEWGAPLLSSQTKVMDAARADASRDGMSGLFVTFAGSRREEHNGVTYAYNVVDAVGVRLVDATPENVIDSLKRLGRVHAIESEFALARATNAKMLEAAPVLLDYVKANTGASTWVPRAIRAYAAVLGGNAAPELSKVLRFHPNDAARIAGGSELVQLGESKTVQDALATERADGVRAALQAALLK